MSPRAFIIERQNQTGRTWQVRYSVRGRTTKVHWGTFRTKRDDERARDYVNGQLAVGRYPHPTEMVLPPKSPTLHAAYTTYMESYPTPSLAVVKLHKQAYTALRRHAIHRTTIDRVTTPDLQAYINFLADEFAPATARKYFAQLKAALEHAGVSPNPAAASGLRFPLPNDEDEETVDPQPWPAFTLMLDALPERHMVTALFLERHGLRSKELAELRVGDLDLQARVLRIRRSRTKRRTGGQRRVPLVGLWAEYLDAHVLPPLEDRDMDGLVFPWFNANTFRGALNRATKFARVQSTSPHQLRHRYITLLMQAGIDPAMVARIAGHRKLSITQDTYTHVLVGEPSWRLDELRTGVASVSGVAPPPTRCQEPPAKRMVPGRVGDTGLEL